MELDVSVIVPVYNVENYLESCLESLKNQTHRNFEVLIIDDGSKDNSSIIAKQFCESDNRFKYTYQENKGLGGARNTGISIAKGRYVTFLDSDDKFPKTAISTLIRHADENNSEVVLGRPMWEKNGELKETYLDNIFDKNYFLKSKDCAYVCLVTSQLICKKIIDKHNILFLEKVTGEDVEFSLNLQKQIRGIHIITDITYYRTEREDENNKSITQIFTPKIIEDRLKSIERLVNIEVVSKLGCNKYSKVYQNIHFIVTTIKKMQSEEMRIESIKKIKEFSKRVKLPNEMYWVGFNASKRQIKKMSTEKIMQKMNNVSNNNLFFYLNKIIYKFKNKIECNWL